MKKTWVCVALFGLALGRAPAAQWLNYRTPGIPRNADGTPALTAPAPRTADGKPDLSGVWMHEQTSLAEWRRLLGSALDDIVKTNVPGMEIDTVHKYARNVLFDVGTDAELMRPAAVELQRRRQTERDPTEVCAGAPSSFFFRVGLLSEAIKIVQAPRTTVIMYEAGNLHRQIFTDGRDLPKNFDLPAYLGYSIGRWEGEVFVVDTAGFNDKTRLDGMEHPHSEALHVTERFRRRDFGHMDMEVTFADPVMYTRPFTIKVAHDLLPDADIFETFCENERDRVHIQNAASGGPSR